MHVKMIALIFYKINTWVIFIDFNIMNSVIERTGLKQFTLMQELHHRQRIQYSHTEEGCTLKRILILQVKISSSFHLRVAWYARCLQASNHHHCAYEAPWYQEAQVLFLVVAVLGPSQCADHTNFLAMQLALTCETQLPCGRHPTGSTKTSVNHKFDDYQEIILTD